MADELQRLLQQSSQTQQFQDGSETPGLATNNNSNVAGIASGIPGGNASLCEKLVFLAENERQSPELLPYPGEILQQLEQEMKQRREEIDTMRQQSHRKGGSSAAENDPLLGITNTEDNNNGDDAEQNKNPNLRVQISASSTLPFRVEDLLNLEMTRLKYAVADLIRVRLQKLQFFREAILAEPTRYDPLLSENELLLVQSLSEIFTKAMLQGGLSQLPEEYRPEPSAAIPRPDNNTYVLAIALEPSEIYLQGVNEPRTFGSGESVICPYESVRRHVIDGKMRLM